MGATSATQGPKPCSEIFLLGEARCKQVTLTSCKCTDFLCMEEVSQKGTLESSTGVVKGSWEEVHRVTEATD